MRYMIVKSHRTPGGFLSVSRMRTRHAAHVFLSVGETFGFRVATEHAVQKGTRSFTKFEVIHRYGPRIGGCDG